MTAKEMTAYVGKTGTYKVGGFCLTIVVEDVRRVFNRVDFLIAIPSTSYGASGFQWVSEDAVKLF